MSRWKNKSFTNKVKFRITMLWIVLILMLIYMVVVGELGLGDSRYMTQLASAVSNIIFFGGMIYVISKLIRNKKLLKNKALLVEEAMENLDERNQFLYDKSGGIVVDILLLFILFVTCTMALWDMEAFYASLSILLVTVISKIVSYFIYSRMH